MRDMTIQLILERHELQQQERFTGTILLPEEALILIIFLSVLDNTGALLYIAKPS